MCSKEGEGRGRKHGPWMWKFPPRFHHAQVTVLSHQAGTFKDLLARAYETLSMSFLLCVSINSWRVFLDYCQGRDVFQAIGSSEKEWPFFEKKHCRSFCQLFARPLVFSCENVPCLICKRILKLTRFTCQRVQARNKLDSPER